MTSTTDHSNVEFRPSEILAAVGRRFKDISREISGVSEKAAAAARHEVGATLRDSEVRVLSSAESRAEFRVNEIEGARLQQLLVKLEREIGEGERLIESHLDATAGSVSKVSRIVETSLEAYSLAARMPDAVDSMRRQYARKRFYPTLRSFIAPAIDHYLRTASSGIMSCRIDAESALQAVGKAPLGQKTRPAHLRQSRACEHGLSLMRDAIEEIARLDLVSDREHGVLIAKFNRRVASVERSAADARTAHLGLVKMIASVEHKEMLPTKSALAQKCFSAPIEDQKKALGKICKLAARSL